MKRKSQMKEYDAQITAYYNRERIQRELNEFYIFTSFRRSHNMYENPMHTREYNIIDDDTLDCEDNNLNNCYTYFAPPSPSPNLKSSEYGIPELSPVSSDSGSKEDRNNDKDVSFETITTLHTTLDPYITPPCSARRKKESVQHSFMDGLSRSSPSTGNISGVSYASENSSILDLKIKKRLIERTFERNFNVIPEIVEVSSKV